MPELPEVETVRAGLELTCAGRTIATVAAGPHTLRFAWPRGLRARLEGQVIASVERRAKYILIGLANGWTWLAHLGMTGSFRFEDGCAAKPRRPHDHLRIRFADGAQLVYHDPRRFGFMDLIAPGERTANRFLNALGPEPLTKEFNPSYLARELAGRTGPIKPALMDAKLVVGVGNIYASESLFQAGIDPRRAALTLSQTECAALVHAIRTVLRAAIQSGGSTLRNYAGVDGLDGRFQHRFAVYDRTGAECRACICTPSQTGGIQKIQQAGRSTFYCPTKQR